MNPVIWTPNNGGSFLVCQNLQENKKIELYKKRKQEETVSSLSKEYQINSSMINYLVRLIDRHGFNILRFNKNNYYLPELKLEIINKVLIDGQSSSSAAIEFGLTSDGLLIARTKRMNT